MGRQPLPLNSYGKIRTTKLATNLWQARTIYCDSKGHIRRPGARGRSKTEAENNLRESINKMSSEKGTGEINRDTRFKVVAERYLKEQTRLANKGANSPTTPEQYTYCLNKHILPELGELRMHQVTGTVCDDLVTKKHDAASYSTAKMVRTALSGVCQLAVRHGALDNNPVQSISRLVEGDTKDIVHLAGEQRVELLARLEKSVQRHTKDSQNRSLGVRSSVWLDLPDLMRCMLATGMRIGEVLALVPENFFFDSQRRPLVCVEAHIVRVKGQGLVRLPNRKHRGKGHLILQVPQWAVPVFLHRKIAAEAGQPLFPSARGGWLDPKNTRDRISKEMDACGYGWVTSHVFRKTVGTELGNADQSAAAIGDQLGDSATIAEKHYRARRIANAATVAVLEGMLKSDTKMPS